jgi:hypothetical protein
MTLQEIASKHNLTIDYVRDQVIAGTKIEFEDGADEAIAGQIARENIFKISDYYERFAKE